MTEPGDTPQPPSLLRAVVPITLFVLLAGIVGPIFVIVGLNTDGPDADWLLPIGIGITALDIAIGLLIGGARYRSQLKLYHLRTRGRRARARLLKVEQTNIAVNDQPLIKVRVRIEGAGIPDFEAEDRMVVSPLRMPLLTTGELPVLVDPETREWEIDWDSARPVPPVSSSVLPPPQRTPTERLTELDDLLRRDLVSREEYDATRARILGDL